MSSWYQKSKDSAIGTSFDQHVVGGYRFLMRFYSPGDEIYMFGFSRGAYVARFLAEMLDHIGLLCHGNEEMIRFAWKAFSQWQSRAPMTDSDGDENEEAEKETQRMYEFLKGFRETFSRPIGRIRFLGLFDTVNSVPRFETSWMQRSKFPYTARSSAMVIRHAVSIDERRAKFRQDLMYQRRPGGKHHHHHHHHHHIGDPIETIRRSMEGAAASSSAQPQNGVSNGTTSAPGAPADPGKLLSPDDAARGVSAPERGRGRGNHQRKRSRSRYAPYRARLRGRRDSRADGHGRVSCDGQSDVDVDVDDDDQGTEMDKQDIDEVWFAGGHGDVGGGWRVPTKTSASHVPLSWIVREAMKAGLHFDMAKVEAMECPSAPRAANNPEILIQGASQDEEGELLNGPDAKPETNGAAAASEHHDDSIHGRAHTFPIHDSLTFASGMSRFAVAAWNFMEYMPFMRMDLRDDGSWKPIRWPLPRGEVRDVPPGVRVHGSVIRRLKADKTYRPGNLIVGGGGRGFRRAPDEYGMGDWVCVAERGDAVGEIWMRREDARELGVEPVE